MPGGHLIDGIEKAAQYAEGGEDMTEKVEERANEQSLAQLERMMRGVR